jgi:nicotinate-nucleotide pyrophosphorylase (carboxylating)
MPTDLNALTLAELYKELNAQGLATRLLELAREEDLGSFNWETADVTSTCFVDDWLRGEGKIVAREPGTVAGLACLDEILNLYRADVDAFIKVPDGQTVQPGQTIATLKGKLRPMLMAERTILNILSRLSGVATTTAAFVAEAAKGGQAKVHDTRKTTPGLRMLEKYAVRCGGGFCHRLGLADAVLIKDNHLAVMKDRGAAGDLATLVRNAVSQARLEAPREGLRFVMLEVESIDQMRQVIEGNAVGPGDNQAGILLLDNMSTDQLKACVQLRDQSKARVELEASGGVRLETIAAISSTGVDRISAGALTRGALSLDIGLDF